MGQTMPPAFPEAARIELKAPPLELVVCQVRFPTILELAGGQTLRVSARARSAYPVTRTQQTSAVVELQPGPGPHTTLSTIWRFDDRESAWTVTLGTDFLALETKRYQRFDDFIGRFMDVLSWVREIYSVELRERIGLRYIDRINRQQQERLPQTGQLWFVGTSSRCELFAHRTSP